MDKNRQNPETYTKLTSMASSSLHKLLKRSSISPIFLTPTKNPNPQIPFNPLFFTQSDFTEPKHDVLLHPLSKLSPFLLGSTTKDETLTTHFTKSVFYPNSPFGLLLDPICSTGSIQSTDEADVGIWADSVKKKRKKKMNKHKYQKLRKRLRRQT